MAGVGLGSGTAGVWDGDRELAGGGTQGAKGLPGVPDKRVEIFAPREPIFGIPLDLR